MSKPSTASSSPSSSSLSTGGLNKVSGIFEWMDSKIDQYINPRVIILVLIVIFMGYFVVNALAGEDLDNENTLFANISILEIFLWAILIIIVLLNGFQYFFNTNITTEITNLLSC